MQTIRIFISSPGDVADERQIAGKVIERIQGKYWSFVRLDDVFWEDKVIRATAHYQDELINPGECEIVFGILWSRLGSPLPRKFQDQTATDPRTGTEWELEEAIRANRASYQLLLDSGKSDKEANQLAKPDVVVYRRRSEPLSPVDPESQAIAREQRRLLARYIDKRFHNEDEHRTIKRPITNYSSLEEFESKLSRNLEELILRKIPALKSGFVPPPISGSPFKGLQSFDFSDSDRYFGRNREIREIQRRLIVSARAGLPFILIYGGSGYGKSSLMRAGLAPVLTRPGGSLDQITGWRRVSFQPAKGTGTLCDHLALALLRKPTPVEAEQSRLNRHWPLTGLAELQDKANPESSRLNPWASSEVSRGLIDDNLRASAITAVTRTLEALDRHLLLEIDQLEEIFTAPAIDSAQRSAFLRVIGDLCLGGRVWVVATMRSEFFPRIAEQAELFDLVGKDRGYILPPPDRQSLREIIRYPALAARLEFQRRNIDIQIAGETAKSEYLDDQILADAETSPDALPLLEFTLQQLYEQRDDHHLTWASYAGAGGLKGAIAQRAATVYQTLSPDAKKARDRIFAALVHIDPSRGTVTRQRALLHTLKTGTGSSSFLDAFLSAHLLVTDEDAVTNKPVVTLAHEALISHWDELSVWIKQHQSDLLARQRLREQTLLWAGNVKSRLFLLSEARLAEAERIAERGLFTLTDDESLFLQNSKNRARAQLRFLQVAVVVFAIITVAAGAFAFVSELRKREVEKSRSIAESRRKDTQKTLASGLTRTIGQSPNTRIGPAEQAAIKALAQVPANDDAVREQFMESVFVSADNATRFLNRGEITLHAVVGCNPGLRHRFFDLAYRSITKERLTGSPKQAAMFVCSHLADSAEENAKAAGLIIEAMEATNDLQEIARLSLLIEAVPKGFAGANADVIARKIVGSMRTSINPEPLNHLARGLCALAPALDPASAASIAEVLAVHIGKESQADRHNPLGGALAAIALRMKTEDVEEMAEKIVSAMDIEINTHPLNSMGIILNALATRLGPQAAREFAIRLRKIAGRDDRPIEQTIILGAAFASLGRDVGAHEQATMAGIMIENVDERRPAHLDSFFQSCFKVVRTVAEPDRNRVIRSLLDASFLDHKKRSDSFKTRIIVEMAGEFGYAAMLGRHQDLLKCYQTSEAYSDWIALATILAEIAANTSEESKPKLREDVATSRDTSSQSFKKKPLQAVIDALDSNRGSSSLPDPSAREDVMAILSEIAQFKRPSAPTGLRIVAAPDAFSGLNGWDKKITRTEPEPETQQPWNLEASSTGNFQLMQLRSASAGLSPDAVDELAKRANDDLSKTSDFMPAGLLGRAIFSLGAGVSDKAASEVIQRMIHLLANEPPSMDSIHLINALEMSASRMTSMTATEVTAMLIDILQLSGKAQTGKAILPCYRAVADRVPREEAQRLLSELLIPAQHFVPEDLEQWLDPLLCKLDRNETLNLLKAPFCTEEIQKPCLLKLGGEINSPILFEGSLMKMMSHSQALLLDIESPWLEPE